jgi:hypothetical protein
MQHEEAARVVVVASKHRRSRAEQRRRSSGTASIKHDSSACACRAVIGAGNHYQHGLEQLWEWSRRGASSAAIMYSTHHRTMPLAPLETSTGLLRPRPRRRAVAHRPAQARGLAFGVSSSMNAIVLLVAAPELAGHVLLSVNRAWPQASSGSASVGQAHSDQQPLATVINRWPGCRPAMRAVGDNYAKQGADRCECVRRALNGQSVYAASCEPAAWSRSTRSTDCRLEERCMPCCNSAHGAAVRRNNPSLASTTGSGKGPKRHHVFSLMPAYQPCHAKSRPTHYPRLRLCHSSAVCHAQRSRQHRNSLSTHLCTNLGALWRPSVHRRPERGVHRSCLSVPPNLMGGWLQRPHCSYSRT